VEREERDRERDTEREREREGEKRKGTERWANGGPRQELKGAHSIIVALKCSAAKIFASDMRR
jgi:hypothetical protein